MKLPVNIPQPKTTYYPLKGGLDLVTPAIAIDPGKCFDALNYVPEITGGYKRLYGYERFSGRPAPSSAAYWVMRANIAGAIPVGATVTGVTSGAVSRVLQVVGDLLILGRKTLTYQVGENLTISAVVVGSVASAALQNGAEDPMADANYAALAADDLRIDIAPVPGSGPIRGLLMLNDLWYAFRDNAGATAGAIYRQSTTGWVAVPLGSEIQFTGAVGEILAGQTITGGTSGATAQVVRPLLRTGTWTVAGEGTLIITAIIGTFSNGEEIRVGGVKKAVAAGTATAIARNPGGRVDGDKATFTGQGTNRKFYGADGVNLGFEFDGTTYVPIRTGMPIDTPTHACVHKNHLFFSFGSSLQNSSIANPYMWTAVTGAAEFAAGATITGMQSQPGNAEGASMAVFTKERTLTLYGSSTLDFNLVPGSFELGFSAYTFQAVGNDIYGLTARGIQALRSTQEYGDFLFNAVSFPIQPLIQALRGKEVSSVTSQVYSHYRLYFTDGTGIVVGLTGGKVSGMLPINYGRVVRVIAAETLSTGQEVIMFGSDDGYVYQDDIGTSFDGQPIESWIRLAFNNLSSPQVRKRFIRAVFDVKAEGYAQASVAYDLGYANPDVSASELSPLRLVGAGGYWDQVRWDNFTWDTQVVATARVSMDGTENNVAFLFYSKSARDKVHTVQGITLEYVPRRISRGS